MLRVRELSSIHVSLNLWLLGSARKTSALTSGTLSRHISLFICRDPAASSEITCSKEIRRKANRRRNDRGSGRRGTEDGVSGAAAYPKRRERVLQYSLNTSSGQRSCRGRESFSVLHKTSCAAQAESLELKRPLPGRIRGIPTIVLPKGPSYNCLQDLMSDRGSENNSSGFKRRKSPPRLLH